jgi:hypothetical protein
MLHESSQGSSQGSSQESSHESSVTQNEFITIDIAQENCAIEEVIGGERSLSLYTDEHFISKLNEELEKIRNQKTVSMGSNSPIIMSNNNSDDEDYADEEFDTFYEYNVKEKAPFKKLTFQEVRSSINKYYDSDDKYSNELDILTTYLKGQKNLYLKSKSITQTKINMLMIPSLIGTSIITIFAPIIQSYNWSGAFISGLNACVALLISIIHYLKLESSADMYLHLTSKYDRLESSLEFTNNKLAFMDSKSDKNELVLTRMKETEKKINEIKETTNIVIPDEVKRMFPIICHVNIFSFIKRIEVYKKNLIVKLKDIKNEMHYIQWKWSNDIEAKPRMRLEFLHTIKDKIKSELLHYKNVYGCVDELFMKEIKRADNVSLWNTWCVSKKNAEISENPILKDYFSTMLTEYE